MNDKVLSRYLINAGTTYYNINDYENAKKYLPEGLELSKNLQKQD